MAINSFKSSLFSRPTTKIFAGLFATGLLLIVLASALSGANPLTVIQTMLGAWLENATLTNRMLESATALIILGVSVSIALRAGLFNIGSQGQFLMGGLAGTVVALRVPGVFGIVLGIIAGGLAGGLWALPAGLLKSWRGAHEVISTIMLNNIAIVTVQYLVSGPLLGTTNGFPGTASFEQSSKIPPVFRVDFYVISLSLVASILFYFGYSWWSRSTVDGYEFAAVGENPTAARFAGIKSKAIINRAMVLSGIISGIGGALQVLAFRTNFDADFASSYGFDALGVALMSGGNPWLVLPSALLFAVLGVGSNRLQSLPTPVSSGVGLVIMAILVVIAAAIRAQGVKKNNG